jgi:hypothetical protein
VLGVSASGRDAGCGGEDWEMVVLKYARTSLYEFIQKICKRSFHSA